MLAVGPNSALCLPLPVQLQLGMQCII